MTHWDRDAPNLSASMGDTGVQHLPRAGRAKSTREISSDYRVLQKLGVVCHLDRRGEGNRS